MADICPPGSFFPHLSPASPRETDGEILLAGGKSAGRATNPPIASVFFHAPAPLQREPSVYTPTLVAALARLWGGLSAALANTAAARSLARGGTGQQYPGPEDISTQRPELIPISKH